MPKIIVPRYAFFFSIVFVAGLFFTSFADAGVSSDQTVVLDRLQKNNQALARFEGSLKIGVPHPTAKLIQQSDGLLAWERKSNFLYLKGYQPLIPVYFLLKSRGNDFELFFPRSYTVYRGNDSVLERQIDIDLKLIPQDIKAALKVFDLPSDPTFLLTPNRQDLAGYALSIKRKDGSLAYKITLDSDLYPRFTVIYNEFGYPYLEISKDDWRTIENLSFPFQIKIKRLLPRPSELILEFKEIRPNVALEPKIFSNQFPSDAKVVELK